MSLLTNFARGVKVELIAKLATSYEAYDGGTLIKGVAPHNIRDYFRKYGSTVRKFEHVADGDIYVGYVRMSHKPEFLSAIVLAGGDAVAVSFDSEVDGGNDFLTLMAKKEFADRMTVAVQRAAAQMKKAATSTHPPPQAPERTTASAPVGQAGKGNDWISWMAILIVIGIIGAVIVIPMLDEDSYPDSNAPAEEQAGQTALTDQYDAPSLNGPSYDSLEAPTSPDDTLGEIGNTALTLGMLDSIMGGIDEFVAVYPRGGMLEAVPHSRQCFSQAESSAQISDLDKCAAFDFTAQFIDNAAVSQGLPPQQYFVETNRRLDALYARFPQHNVERLALIKGQTAVVMRENGIGY